MENNKNEIEKVQTEDSELKNQENSFKFDEGKKDFITISKRNLRIIISVLIIALLSAGTGFGYYKYKEDKKEKKLYQQMRTIKDSQKIDSAKNEDLKNEKDGSTGSSISESEISTMAAKHLNLSENDVKIKKIKTDYTDDYGLTSKGEKKRIYEVKIIAKNIVYEMDIEAATGKVLKSKIDD